MDRIVFSLKLLIALCIASLIGLGGTWIVLEADVAVSTVRVGPWLGRLPVGRGDANPYVRAELARTGAVPLTATESIVFSANTDSGGNALDSACEYSLSSGRIDSRWWTMTLTAADGKLIGTPNLRHAFNSGNLMRANDGTFVITVSSQAAPGNWLPTGNSGRFVLTLRLYDTALFTNGGLPEAQLPRIERGACQ